MLGVKTENGIERPYLEDLIAGIIRATRTALEAAPGASKAFNDALIAECNASIRRRIIRTDPPLDHQSSC